MLKRILRENGRDYIGTYAIAIFCMLLIAATTAFLAWIMEDVINEAFVNQDAQAIWYVSGGILAAFVIRGIASYVEAVSLNIIGNNIVARYQQRLFDHLMALNLSYFSDTRSAQIAAQISQNVTGIRDTLNMTITLLARDIVTLVALIVVMFSKDAILSMVVFFVAPPIVLSLRYIARRLRTATRQAIDLNSQVLGAMQETVQGITIVKSFTMEDRLSERISHIIGNAEQRANRIARLGERTAPITETLSGVAISSVIVYAAYRSIHNNVPPGAFFSFITALLLAYDPARRLTKLQINLEKAVVNARMIYEILDTEPLQGDKENAVELEVTNGQIEFNDVSFRYPDSELVLDNVSFAAQAGKTTAIVGPSGAGKSTIISLVPRFYDPISGNITIDGVDIEDVTKSSLRKNIAYVSQQPWLFEGSIRDNIRYGLPEASDAEIEEAAKLAHAHDFILEQPQGYDTPVGENGITLSGGQRQRLSIARALVRNAPILILDEATSALDNESEAAVQKALDKAMKGRTVLVIAHRLSTIAKADKIVVMEAGKVVEQGSHAELSEHSDGVYSRLQKIHSRGNKVEMKKDNEDE
ncbi:MAG: ABC transporter ATP-binding protein [Rhizobiaceae bacterium]|nr:ABC transporter ATP-binding protein [Rhizobiaceae bacterium]